MTLMNVPHQIALMIDIEALGLSPDARILQVGWCVGDLTTKQVVSAPSSRLIDVDGQATRTVDFSTLSWWMEQDKAVSAAVFNMRVWRVTLQDLFEELERVLSLWKDCTVWASPAMYDLPMLTHAWGGKKPWKYNVERDMMTLYKLLDPKGELKPPPNGKAHDAGADAEWQLQYLFRLFDYVQGWAQGAV